MEEIMDRDLHVNVNRQSSLRPSSSFKPTLSGRSTPRNSPTFRRVHSSRTPRREGRGGGGGIQWFRNNRLVYWLLLITLWTYLGFYVQSRWAHGDNNDKFLGFSGHEENGVSQSEKSSLRRDLSANDSSLTIRNATGNVMVADGRRMDVVLAKEGTTVSSYKSANTKKKKKSSRGRRLRGRKVSKPRTNIPVETDDVEVQELDIPRKNTSYGLLLGPFGSIEDKILEWSPEKRMGTCDRKSQFAKLVWSRKFVLIFHELSMTGAPLSMLELATEFLSCGATVSAVVLSKKGGLMPELARRRIKVLEDRADLSFKTAMKADLVIAGSAVCASWIDQYITRFPAGGSQIAWWIMENRREYFNRTMIVLDRVKMVVFLSESQTKQWLTWCDEEKIKLRSPPAIVPLSVNDELAFVAGIPCSLNTPSTTPEKMKEKRQLLRDAVRREMGLSDNDMLVMSLSSINPGKGQLLLVESASLVDAKEPFQNINTLASKHHLRALLHKSSYEGDNGMIFSSKDFLNGRTLLSDSEPGQQEQNLKVLIGSVGSKSNKIFYVKEILRFLSQNSNVSKSVLWTPATTRVASLYSAADVYVINSQGIGETFGRVTIEAMAFGLPVLGTDAGGTKEIVDHNITGLLHPVGRPGIPELARNLRFLLRNPSVRQMMGTKGMKKVEKMYMKRHMYKKFAEVVYKCLRIK